MIIATVTFRLHGGIRILRESKSLSNQDIQNQLETAKKDHQFGCQFCYLPANTKSHDVTLEETICTQRINVSKETFDSIMSGESKPSRHVLQANNLIARKDGKPVFLTKKWQQKSEAERLWLFYRDHALDLGATSHQINFL